MAEQTQPVRRKVALKVIKPGMDTRQVIARFEAERQALALMDHPNIAQVFDGGATPLGPAVLRHGAGQGRADHRVLRPEPPDRRASGWSCSSASARRCSTPIRRASSTATSSRPTSWSTLHDGTPVPKVIDFGIAKATGQQLTEKTLFTGFAQMVGTPLYMSPEQAEHERAGHRHAQRRLLLGVLLYELLTGTTPFDKERLQAGGLRRDPPDHPRGGAAEAEHAARARRRQAADDGVGQPRATRSRHAEPGWCAGSWTGS